jgi:hypothetical protein
LSGSAIRAKRLAGIGRAATPLFARGCGRLIHYLQNTVHFASYNS